MKKLNNFLMLLTILFALSSCSNEKDLVFIDPVVRISNLYGLGLAFGWDSNSAEELVQNEENNSVFTTEKELIFSEENKQFKFILEEGDWDQVRYLVPESVDYNENVKVMTAGVEYKMYLCSEEAGNLRDHFWGIQEGTDGTYLITVNYTTMTVKIEKK